MEERKTDVFQSWILLICIIILSVVNYNLALTIRDFDKRITEINNDVVEFYQRLGLDYEESQDWDLWQGIGLLS